jgi:putative ABC transport system ATP-binding protein
MGTNGVEFKTRGVLLQLRNLVKHYATGSERIIAVNGFSFDAEPGVPVGLVGVSGCGKSTLLNLVGGVDRPDSGSVVVDGVDIAGFGERDIGQHRLMRVGFVFQAYNLVPSLTAAENVQLPMVMAGRLTRSERQERARELLGMVGLRAKATKRPDELSGGEQQRVAIGVALSNDPSILLADEPTANLDHRNLETVLALLTTLSRTYGKTLLVATHDPRVWSHLDIVLRMEEGQVREVYRGLPSVVSSV